MIVKVLLLPLGVPSVNKTKQEATPFRINSSAPSDVDREASARTLYAPSRRHTAMKREC